MNAGAAVGNNVFVSYSRADSAFADELVTGLEFEGDFKILVDRHDIRPGEPWQARIGQLIRRADTVVFVISPESISSEICGWEIKEAQRLSKRIIPIVWREVDFAAAPEGLSILNAIPFHGVHGVSGVKKLAKALREDLGWLNLHTRYLEAAIAWDEAQRDSARLLRGDALREALDWRAHRPANAPALTELQLDYLQASDEEQARLQDEERARLQELLETQTRLKSAEQERANVARRAAKRMRVALGALGVIAVLAVGLAYFFFQERDKANLKTLEAEQNLRQRRVVEAGILTKLAEAALEQNDVGKALALSRASVGRLQDLGQVRVRDRARSLMVRALDRHRERILHRLEGPPAALAVSRDGRRAAVAHGTRVIIYDAAAVAELRSIAFEDAAPTALAFTGSGDALAIGDNRGRLTFAPLDDDPSPALNRVIEAHAGAIRRLAVARDADHVLSSAEDGTLALWSRDGEAVPHAVDGRDGQVAGQITSFALSADGGVIAFADAEGLNVWDSALETSPVRLPLSLACDANGAASRGDAADARASALITTLAVMSDGRVSSGAADGEVRLWSPGESSCEIFIARHPDRTPSANLTTDRFDVIGYDHGSFSLHFGPDAGMTYSGFAAVAGLAASETGETIVTASADGVLRLWSAAHRPGLAFDRRLDVEDEFEDVRLSEAQGRVLTRSGYGAVTVWDIENGARVADIGRDAKRYFTAAIFGPEGAESKEVLTGSESGHVERWSAESGARLGEIAMADGAISSLALAPDGRSLAVGTSDGRWRVWPVDVSADARPPARPAAGPARPERSKGFAREAPEDVPGAVDRSYADAEMTEGHFGEIIAMAFSPDGALLATSAFAGGVKVWRVSTRRERAAFDTVDTARALAFSPDGQWLAAGSDDGAARLFRLATGEPGHVLRGHRDWLRSVAFAPSGDALLTASDDGAVRLWDVATGAPHREIEGSGAYVLRAAFTRAGDAFLVADNAGRVSRWRRWNDQAALLGAVDTVLGETRPLSLSDRCDANLFENLSYEKSLEYCERLGPAPADTDLATALALRGAELLREGRGSESGTAFADALGLAPARAPDFADLRLSALLDRALARLAADDRNGANALLAEALKEAQKTAEPQTARNRIARARFDALIARSGELFELDETDAAEAFLAEAQEVAREAARETAIENADSEIARVRAAVEVRRGETLFSAESFDDAIAAYDAALALAPDLVDAYLGRARARARSGQIDGALDDYRQASTLDPENAQAHADMALILMAAAQLEEAADAAKAALALDPSQRDVWPLLWATARAAGRGEDAAMALAQMLEEGRPGFGAYRGFDPVTFDLTDRDPIAALFLAIDRRAALDAAGVADLGTLREQRLALIEVAYALGLIHAESLLAGAEAVTECDRAAAMRYDPYRIAETSHLVSEIKDGAVEACTAALAEAADADALTRGRLLFQRARAHTALENREAQFADLEAAAALGYPMAFNNLGYNARYGAESEATGAARGARLYVETVNRVMRCCAMAGVEALERGRFAEHGQSAEAVRQLLSWAAAVGNAEAHRRLARDLAGSDPHAAYRHALIAQRLDPSAVEDEDGNAAARLATLESGLSPAEREAARAEADAWRPRPIDQDPPLLRRLVGAEDLHRELEMPASGQIAADQKGRLLVGASDAARLVEAETGAVLLEIEAPAELVALSANGALAAVSASAGPIQLWDVDAGAMQARFETPGDIANLQGLALSPDGARLAAADGGVVHVWDTETGALERTLRHDGGGDLLGLAFSLDGALIAAGSTDATARLWRVADGALLATLSGHRDWVRSVAFTADGAHLLSGSDDGVARLWALADGAIVRDFEPEDATETKPWVLRVATDAAGARIATSDDSGAARVYDLESGALLRTLDGFGSGTVGVAFGGSGDLLATASTEFNLQLWRLGETSGSD